MYDHLIIDHVCYRVATETRYTELRDYHLQTATLLAASEIGGRPICTFRLAVPFTFGQRQIELLELPAPKPGRPYKEGWEHAEFVTDRPLREFDDWLQTTAGVAADAIDRSGLDKSLNSDLRLRLTEGISVKFHELPLDEVIRLEG